MQGCHPRTPSPSPPPSRSPTCVSKLIAGFSKLRMIALCSDIQCWLAWDVSPALDVVEVARPVARPGGEPGVRRHPRPQPGPRLRPRGGVAEVWRQLGAGQQLQPGLGGLPASAARHLHKHALTQSCLPGILQGFYGMSLLLHGTPTVLFLCAKAHQ